MTRWPMLTKRGRAIEQIGRTLFRDHWIGPQTKAQFDLAARFEGRSLPQGPRLAAAAAIAVYRRKARKVQIAQVLKWWADRGGDLASGEFNQRKFETLYQEVFGNGQPSKPPILRRREAVRTALQAGSMPGWGGISWNKFIAKVNRESRGNWNARTIRRDVDEFRK